MNTTSNEKSYFDLHTSGIGYIQRVREVPVRGGRRAQPFLACTIAALVGPPGPSYRYFDVKVSGAEARSSFSATSALTIPSSARWCAFASVTCGAMCTSATRVSRRVRPPRPSRRDCSRPN